MADYHLVSSANKNYLVYLFVTWQSLIDSLDKDFSQERDHLVFHALIDDTVDLNKAQLYADSFKELNVDAPVSIDVAFHMVDPSAFSKFPALERDGGSSYTTFYRLIFAQVLSHDIQRFAYLDVDIVVLKDIRLMFKQHPLSDEAFYAAPEMFYSSIVSEIGNRGFEKDKLMLLSRSLSQEKETLHIDLRNCFQAGVLLVNMDQWLKQDIEGKSMEAGNKWIPCFFDQDLLAIAADGKVGHLSWEWNVTIHLYKGNIARNECAQSFYKLAAESPLLYTPTLEQVESMMTDPAIVHFSGSMKPWSPSKQVQDSFGRPDLMCFVQKWLKSYARFATHIKNRGKA